MKYAFCGDELARHQLVCFALKVDCGNPCNYEAGMEDGDHMHAHVYKEAVGGDRQNKFGL